MKQVWRLLDTGGLPAANNRTVIKPKDWEKESAQLFSSNDLPDWVESEIKRYRS
ncbi:MAG: hypothetical protein ACD_75C02399G0001 [uncultured bacterium]|nr:MAG: hypothetical protein ACD_75C02399G0001 [uncultured bacterium]